MKEHFEGKKHECPCGVVFKYRQSLTNHYKLVHKDDETGKYALESRKPDATMVLALKGNDGLKFKTPHTCCLCKKICSTRGVLVKHINGFHKKSPPLFCDHCPKIYNTKPLLTGHMRVHCKNYYACDVCEFKSVYKTELSRHKVLHEPKATCPICNKQVSCLRNHSVSHKPMKRCRICQKMISRGYFRDHLERHEKNKAEMKCKQCHETFVSCEGFRM